MYGGGLDSEFRSVNTDGQKTVFNNKNNGSMNAWNNYISNKDLEIKLYKRIIQSWKINKFSKATSDSILWQSFQPLIKRTRFTVFQHQLPPEQYDDYPSRWMDYHLNRCGNILLEG